MGLYGSIPYISSFSSNHSGNIGIYWLNSAETWVDIYTASNYAAAENYGTDNRRGIIWSSETNLIEFVLIIASDPKDLLGKWATVTGFAPLPPYFSLGYHQSRWSYYSADDISNVNFRFDFHEMPYDVIWLDIDVSLFIFYYADI